MIIPLQVKCQSPEEAPRGPWAEMGLGNHSSPSSPGSTRLESSSGHSGIIILFYEWAGQGKCSCCHICGHPLPHAQAQAGNLDVPVPCAMLWLQAGSCELSPSQVSIPCHKPPSLTELLVYKSQRNSSAGAPGSCTSLLNLCHMPWSI